LIRWCIAWNNSRRWKRRIWMSLLPCG
jgi:hypothetical protein